MSRYLAFISYRHHERDQKISALLRRGLENCRLPESARLPKKRRVFRDTDELPTSVDLGEDIRNALQESEWMIALCSPEYIESKWCMREIQLFIEAGKKDRILPVLVSGEPEAAVPPEIRDVPLAGDLSGIATRALRHAADPIVFSLLAKMSEADTESIARTERRRRLFAGSVAFAAAAAVVLGFTVYAVRTAARIADNNAEIETATRAAEEARAEAIKERNDALLKSSQYYGQRAWDAIHIGENREAVSLALSGLPEDLSGGLPYEYETLSALRTALSFPAKPAYTYTLKGQIPADFTITGWTSVDGVLYLKDELFYQEQNVCADNRTRHCLSILNHTIQELSQVPEGRTVSRMLNGEPYYADHFWEMHYIANNEWVAWLENPKEGQQQHTVLIHEDEEEAIELKTDGSPVSVCYNTGTDIYLVDRGGTLRRFNYDTGETLQVADDRYAFVCWSANGGVLLAATEEGKAVMLDSTDFSVLRESKDGALVRTLQPCMIRNSILACCKDGFRVYDADDMHLLTEVITEEMPLDAVWGGFDETITHSHDGNSVVLLFSDRVEIYTLTLTEDNSPLYRPLIQDGKKNRCKDVLFSADGSRVFLEMTNGDLSAWDTKTAQQLWSNSSGYTRPLEDPNIAISADGKAIWRVRHEKEGYDRVDFETGETVYTLRMDLDSYPVRVSFPKENHGGTQAVVYDHTDNEYYLIDCQSGKKLTTFGEAPGQLFFSQDDREIRTIRTEDDTSTGEVVYRYIVRDPETFEDTVNQELFRTVSEDYCRIYPFQDGKCCVVLSTEGIYKYGKEQQNILRVIEIPSGEVLGEYRIYGSEMLVITPWDGSLALEWKEGDTRYYCRIGEDGKIGSKATVEDPEGRSMTTDQKKHMRLAEEDGYLKDSWTLVGVQRNVVNYAVMRRFLDDMILIEKESDGSISMATSPNGSYLCIYGAEYTPLLVRAVTPEELLVLGRQMTEGGD